MANMNLSSNTWKLSTTLPNSITIDEETENPVNILQTAGSFLDRNISVYGKLVTGSTVQMPSSGTKTLNISSQNNSNGVFNVTGGKTYIKATGYNSPLMITGGTSSSPQATYVWSANAYSYLRIYGGDSSTSHVVHISSASQYNYFSAYDTTHIKSSSSSAGFIAVGDVYIHSLNTSSKRIIADGNTYIYSSSTDGIFQSCAGDTYIRSYDENSSYPFTCYGPKTYLKSKNYPITNGTSISYTYTANNSNIYMSSNSATYSSSTNNGGRIIVSSVLNATSYSSNSTNYIQCVGSFNDSSSIKKLWVKSATNYDFIGLKSGTYLTCDDSRFSNMWYGISSSNYYFAIYADNAWRYIIKNGAWQCVTPGTTHGGGHEIVRRSNDSSTTLGIHYGAYTANDGKTYYGKFKIISGGTNPNPDPDPDPGYTNTYATDSSHQVLYWENYDIYILFTSSGANVLTGYTSFTGSYYISFNSNTYSSLGINPSKVFPSAPLTGSMYAGVMVSSSTYPAYGRFASLWDYNNNGTPVFNKDVVDHIG